MTQSVSLLQGAPALLRTRHAGAEIGPLGLLGQLSSYLCNPSLSLSSKQDEDEWHVIHVDLVLA